MKKKFLLPIMLFATIWLISCSKSDDNNLPDFPMVSTIAMGSSTNPNPLKFNYDSENRLVSYGFGDNAIFSYTYSNSTVTKKTFGMFGQVLQTDIYTLNNKGQAVSCVTFPYSGGSFKSTFTIPGGIVGDSTETTYEYDENGYMTRKVMEIFPYDTAITIYTIHNGNIISETISSEGYFYSRSYDYYTDKPNTIGDENQGIYFLGKQSVNLVRTISSTSVEKTYTYEFDDRGRVSRQSSIPGEGFDNYFTYRE